MKPSEAVTKTQHVASIQKTKIQSKMLLSLVKPKGDLLENILIATTSKGNDSYKLFLTNQGFIKEHMHNENLIDPVDSRYDQSFQIKGEDVVCEEDSLEDVITFFDLSAEEVSVFIKMIQ
jgi:hypothetical protein